MKNIDIKNEVDFSYAVAFGRNRGFIQPSEQERLTKARIAVAGLGGVGSAQVQALARLGIGKFTLADLDVFELSNFNRQLGARMDTLGKKKTEVSRQAVHSVNPEADVTLIENGIRRDTIDAFLQDADLVVDALDFNCFEERFLLYKRAREKGLWVINVAPPGFGMTLLVFNPKGMSFENYFDLQAGLPKTELALRFMCGITPSLLPLRYVDRKNVTLEGEAFPCVSPAFFLAAGVTATEVFNLLNKKNPSGSVPWVYQFDAFLREYKRKYYPFGMRSPWQRLKRWMIRRMTTSRIG